jgi:hypothetical protein
MSTAVLLLLFARTDAQILTWPAFKSYLCGPSIPIKDPCGAMVDQDLDGDVDLRDWAAVQNKWSCLAGDPNICGRITLIAVPDP